MKLIVTCEHGGNIIPKVYKTYLENHELALDSHRGYDLGALDLFKTLEALADYALYSETSRLLIELNRSLHHPNLFSNFTKNISEKEKQTLIQSYYLVYRKKVENTIQNWIKKEENVLHISVHSFTPVLNNSERHCDVGLLYDSKKLSEKSFCAALKSELKILKPNLNVRYNYPYLGKADGFTTSLRKQFQNNYMGIEVEINQKYCKNNKIEAKLKAILLSALNTLIKQYPSNYST